MNRNRIDAVATALANGGYDGITAFDRTEPEYSTLENLYERYDSEAHVKLIGILAASQDYKLNGTAQHFWQQLDDTAAQYEALESTQVVRDLMGDFMETDINASNRDQKRRRLVYLLDSGFDEWFVNNHSAVQPLAVWRRLADGLNNSMDSQTVVLAMKIYDIAHLIKHNEYLAFPSEIPIPRNRQVARVAQSSGIVDSTDADDVLDAWAEVIEQTSDQLDKNLSLLRIDSIVFQAGQVIGQHEPDRAAAREALVEYFESVLLESGKLDQLATELTVAV